MADTYLARRAEPSAGTVKRELPPARSFWSFGFAAVQFFSVGGADGCTAALG